MFKNKEPLFNSKENVFGLYKRGYERLDGNSRVIYYINIYNNGGKTLEEELMPIDIFVDKLLLDNDYIKYVSKNKEEILELFDKEMKIPSIFMIWLKDNKMEKYEVFRENNE